MPITSQVLPGDANVVGRRLAAFAFDVVVVAALTALILLPTNLALRSVGLAALTVQALAELSTGVVAIVTWVYFTLPETLFGSTVGKLALGLRVVCVLSGGKPSFRQAAVRNLGRFVDTLFFGAPALVAISTSPLRQRVGDRWANTTVVAWRR